MVPAACKGQKRRWEKIFYRNGGKCLKVFETIRRERENETSRDKGGVDFFMKGIYMYLYWEGNAKKTIKRKSLSLGQAEFLQDKIPVTVVRQKGK